MRLSEVLQHPYPWKMLPPNGFRLEARFDTKTGPCSVVFEKVREGGKISIWVLSFAINDSYELTKAGNAFQILSTVGEISEHMVVTARPDKFQFFTWLDEKSRVKLYNKLAKRIADKTGYGLEIEPEGLGVYYNFTRVLEPRHP